MEKAAELKQRYEQELSNWVDQEKTAIALINVVSNLWYEKSVKLKMFRKQMIDRGATQMIKLHDYGKNIIGHSIPLQETLKLAETIAQMNLAPCCLDVGKLGIEWLEEHGKYHDSYNEFIQSKLADYFQSYNATPAKPRDIILYGFGRIGRLCARELLEQEGSGGQLRLRAIVTRSNSEMDIQKRADLLSTDSVHGKFLGTVEVDHENRALKLNGSTIYMIAADKPSEIDYSKYGIEDAIIIDNTGVWRDQDGLSQHLQSAGTSKVLLTAPGKQNIPNIVFGVNHQDVDYSQTIFSAASCTTNAIVPVLSVIENKIGIEKGHIESIHAYTNDQNLLDNFHKKFRRGKSAALNMVITETGAGKAVVKAIPSLKDKLTANAVRIPTPNGSLAVMSLTLKKETSKEEINNIMKDAALKGDLVEQIRYSYSKETVSNDIVGVSVTSIFDAPSTIVSQDKKSIVLYVWYDNEYGYTRQVIRLAKKIAGVRLKSYL